MSVKLLLNYALIIDAVLMFGAIALVIRKGAHRRLLGFPLFLGLTGLHMAMDDVALYHRKPFGMSVKVACDILSYGACVASALEGVLLLFITYGVYRKLMEPFPGLQRIGTLAFRWVGGLALALSIMVMCGPHSHGFDEFGLLVGRMHEGVALLTLALLLAVSLATRPLGLSLRSRAFGTLVGMGVLSTVALVCSTWFSQQATASPYAFPYLVGALGSLVATSTWITYYVLPEPARQIITLPTTSPFFFWNRIADALGDAPGRVAVAGVTPDMFAPAELLAFRARPVQAPVVEMPQTAQR